MKPDQNTRWHTILWTCFVLVVALFAPGRFSSQTLLQESVHSALRILSPKEGEVLHTNIVRCKYEQVEPASQDEAPTFQLQLDDQDPVRTIQTEYTFTGLKEGRHVILIMVLDANNFPIPGTRNEVHFVVSLPKPGQPSSP